MGSRFVSRGRKGASLICLVAIALAGLLAGLQADHLDTFVAAPGATLGATASRANSRIWLRADDSPASPAPAPSDSVALVTVTEEAKIATASVLGGLAGLLVGGIWVGGALFAVSAYLAKRDDDVGKALKGAASGGLEVLNFGSSLNDKYAVTEKVGTAVNDALGENRKTLDTVVGSVKAADKDIGFKDTFGNLVTSASDFGSKAVEKAVDLNKEYKVTDQIATKVKEVTDKK